MKRKMLSKPKIPQSRKHRSSLETLKFENGKFTLEDASTPKLRLQLSKNANWSAIGNDAYTTVDLGAAAALRRFADENVEKIFTRLFQCRYPLPKLPPLPLDPHQWEGVKWALSRKRSYLAHAPGSGKTAEAIFISCFAEGSGQTLFIVPPSLTVNWQREIDKFSVWAGNYQQSAVIPGSHDKHLMNWDAGFIVCPDSMLAKPWVYRELRKRKWKVIAVDEASRFKDPFAERSLAFYGGVKGEKAFTGLFRDARHVVFLDGSPMPNRPMELWAPTFALDPESIDCMGYDDFGYRYCGAKPNERGQWEYLYSSNESELQAKLRKSFMHVVGEEKLTHPERRRSLVFLKTDVRTEEQKTWERRHLSAILQMGVNEKLAERGDIARHRRELGLAKVPLIAAYALEKLDKGESVLLFVWHRDVAVALHRALGRVGSGLVIGGTSAKDRELVFQNFQSPKRSLRCLVMNIAAGGRGHNLQRADRIIFGEWSWTDETNKQCEKRGSRRGNDADFVRCDYLVAPGSFDEPVLNSVFSKERRVKRIIG